MEGTARSMSEEREALVVCSDYNVTSGITVWDLDTGEELSHRPTCASPRHGLVCLANHFLAASQLQKPGSYPGGAIFMWALNKSQVIHRSYPVEPIGPLACTVDGAYLAGGTPSGKIFMWEVASGKLLQCWSSHRKSVTCLRFSDDDSLLISGGDDGLINVWLLIRVLDATGHDLQGTGCPTCLHSWADHTSSISDLAVSTNGSSSVVISCSLDCTCKKTQAEAKEEQSVIKEKTQAEAKEEQSVIKEANQLEFSPCLGLVSSQENDDCLKSVHKEEALNSEAHEHIKNEHQMGNEVESSSEQDKEQSPLREASQLESSPCPGLVSAGQENFDCLKSLHEDETLNSEVHEHVTTENQMENEVESSNKQDGDHSLVKEANQLESSPTLGLVFGQENVDCLSELIYEDEVVHSEYEKENSVLSSNEQDEADGLVEEANQFEFSPCLALVFGQEDDDCLSKSSREDEALSSEIHNIGSKNEQYKKNVLDLVNGQQDADCQRKSLNEAEAMDSETHEIFQCDYQKENDTVSYNEQDEATNHFKLSPPILEENVDCSPSCKEKVTGSPAFSSEKVSDDTPKWGSKDGGQTNSLNLTPEYEVMLSGHSLMAKLSEAPSLCALSPSGSLCAFSSSGFAASGEALDVSPCLNSLFVEEEISNKKASPGVSSARVSSPVSSKASPIFNNLFEEEVITTYSVKPEEEEFSGKRISPCNASMDLSSSVKSPYVCSDDASHHTLFEETKATIQSSIPLNLKQEMEENNRPSQDKLYDSLKSPTGDMELNGIETAQPSATAMELQTDKKISSPASLSKSHGRAPEVSSPCKKQKLNDTSDHEVDEIGCTKSLLEEATARKSIDSSISEEEMKAAGAEIIRQPQLVTAGTMTSCLPSVQRIQNMHNRLQNILEQTEKTLQFERSTPRIKMSASGAKSAIKPRICMKENSPVVLPQLSKTVSKRERETPTAEKGIARRLALQSLPPNISEQFASPNPWRQR